MRLFAVVAWLFASVESPRSFMKDTPFINCVEQDVPPVQFVSFFVWLF